MRCEGNRLEEIGGENADGKTVMRAPTVINWEEKSTWGRQSHHLDMSFLYLRMKFPVSDRIYVISQNFLLKCTFQSTISSYFSGPGSRVEIPNLEWPRFCA